MTLLPSKAGLPLVLPVIFAVLLFSGNLSYVFPLDDITSEKELLSKYKSEGIYNRVTAIQELGDMGTTRAVKYLISILKQEKDPLLVWKILQALKSISSVDANFLLFKTLMETGDPSLQNHLLDILGAIDTPQSSLILIDYTRHSDPKTRTIALLSLANHSSGTFAAIFRKALFDPAWQVRSAAIQGLGREKKSDESISLLIAAMGREQGRLRYDIYEVLKKLTEKDYGPSPLRWRRWWEVVSKKSKTEREKEERENPDRFYGPSYYGIQFLSRRVLFIVDTSGSMNDPIFLGEKELVDIFGKGFDKAELVRTKLDLAKYALVKVLKDMDPGARFNIIFYSSSANTWSRTLLPLASENYRRAYQRIMRCAGSGGTNIWEALQDSLSLMGNSARKNYEEGPDTIFFLTDGEPTVGRVTNPKRILSYFLLKNRTRQIQVHTIGMGIHDKGFLYDLSKGTGGIYKGF